MKSTLIGMSIAAAIVLHTGWPAVAQGQAQPPTDTGTTVFPKEPAQQPEADQDKPWAIDITVDYLTQYFYRGYNVVDKGWIVQPAIDFSYTIHESGDFSITPHIAGWFSLTEEKGPQSPDHLAEADLFTGVAFGYGSFELLIDYNFQGYPSRYGIDESSGEVEEIQFVLSYDDSSHWPEDATPLAGLFPYVGYYHEIDDHNDDDRNAYLEVGLEPTLRDFELAGRSVTVSFPVIAGLSTDSYFTGASGHNENVGYYLVGLKAGVALFDAWTLVGEVDYVHLESTSTIDANDGDEDEVIARVGVTFSI